MTERGPFDLTGRAVLVTGGNSGIGLGIAAGLARAGADTCVAARRADANDEAVASLQGLPGRVVATICDVTQEASVAGAVATTIEAFSRIDGVVVNAGAQAPASPLHEYTLESWREALAINLDGAFLTVRETAARLIEQGEGGSIVVIGSIVSNYGQPTMVPYGVAKAGLESLVRTAAIELARHRIRVNAVLPGWTDTPITRPILDAPDGTPQARAREAITARTPMRRWASPGDFAGITVYLMSPASSFHTGDTITIDGGYTIF